MNKSVATTVPRQHRTICLYFCQEEYMIHILKVEYFRSVLDKAICEYPELFPPDISLKYEMKDIRVSKRLKIYVRRITVNGYHYTVHPSFVMPYMTGFTKDVEKALFLRKFTVPFWALAYCFGKYGMYWYRMEASLGRNNLVGTTIKNEENLPANLAADEKHTWLLGEKVYIAVTAGNGCLLGTEVANSASQDSLTAAYGVFKKEIEDVKPGYKPATVNTDGWDATQNSWKALFPSIAVIACFLHVFIAIRDRAKKKFKELFLSISTMLWHCYKAESKAAFSQRIRRLDEWTLKNKVPPVIMEKIGKLRSNLPKFSRAYDFPGSHRTSNMIDRLMQRMDRHLFSIQYFHGNRDSANLSIRHGPHTEFCPVQSDNDKTT